MFKNKKAQAIAKEYVVYIILGIMALVITAVLCGSYGRPVWNQLISIKGLNATAESQLGLSPFQVFVNEYKQCKMLPDNNCLCPFSGFALPSNGFIEIINNNGLTSFNYFKGQTIAGNTFTKHFSNINDIKYENLLVGCKIKKTDGDFLDVSDCTKDSQFVVSNDKIFVPITNMAASNILNINNPKVFDTNRYLEDKKIVLVANQGQFLSGFQNPVYVYTSVDLNSFDVFDFFGLYKGNDDYLYFISNVATDEAAAIKSSSQLSSNIKKCVIPNDFNKALILFNSFTKSLSECKKTSQRIGTDVLCDKFDFDLPKDYSIKMSPSIQPTIELSYKGTKIKDFKLENNVRVNFEKEFSAFESLIFNIDSSKEPNTITFKKGQIILPSLASPDKKTVYLPKTIDILDSMAITNTIYLEIYKCTNGDICLAPAQTVKGITETAEDIKSIATALAAK